MTNGKPKNRPYEVLIVEDNVDDVELFFRVLQKAQLDMEIEIEPCAVTNGMEAAKHLNERKFDVVFLDLNLPQPDGMELIARARNSQINRSTPIVVITGAQGSSQMTRAFQAGANLFLFKPIDRRQLLRLLEVARVPVDRERRRVRRVKVRCKVSIESGQDRMDGETLDVSLGGMFVQSKRMLPVGSSVNVSLTLPQVHAPIRSAARVVRVVAGEFMAMRLENMAKADSDKLGEFLLPLIMGAPDGGE